jgi:hypothetical protein
MMPTLTTLSSIGSTLSMPFSMSLSIWVTLAMSSFPFVSIPSVPMPIPSIMIPTYGSSSSGWLSLGFNMGSGTPSTFTNPMSALPLLGVGLPFGWNISSSFEPVPSQAGVSSIFRGFNFSWVKTPFPGGTSLGGNF